MLDLVIVVGLAVILLIAIAVRIDRSERRRGRGMDVSKIRANRKIGDAGDPQQGVGF